MTSPASPRIRKVLLVELTAFDSVAPLASGFLQSYAQLDARVKDGYEFEILTFPVSRDENQLFTALERRDADIYGFSCYVWNSKLVRRLVARLLTGKPDLSILLGGPQVMHQGSSYLAPEHPGVSICNGEGEITFQHYLVQHLSETPDLAQVRGLSFHRDGVLITTPPQARITDLDEIPSPYLNGVIKPFHYPYALFETNRGCPFKCAYCYWGGAVGARVNKVSMDRLKAELEWFSRSGVIYLYIVDANWGMLKRDVELSRHFVECQKKTGLPRFIHYCNAKNSPGRTLKIADILQDAAGTNSQPIALQTLSDQALKRIGRSNIKSDAYLQLQTRLNEIGSSSFIEMIWPLPGETLPSFKRGLERLCASNAQSIVVYPLLLMNNVQLIQERDKHALETWPTSDPNGESELVIATADVSEEQCVQGWTFALGVFLLYSMRGLFHLSSYLHMSGRRSFATLVDEFMEYIDRAQEPLLIRLRDHSLEWASVELSTNGHVTYFCCHENREEFDDALARFVAEQSWWQDRTARALFEVDLLNRPYVYRNPTIAAKAYAFTELEVCEVMEDGYVVNVPFAALAHGPQVIDLAQPSAPDTDAGTDTVQLKVCHWRDQMFPADASTPMHRKEKSCYASILLIESILPHWSVARPA